MSLTEVEVKSVAGWLTCLQQGVGGAQPSFKLQLEADMHISY